MKKVLGALILFVVALSAYGQKEAVKTGPQIHFDEKLFNFGTITQGDTVEHTFLFKNIGVEALRITSARGSCGCTVPSFTKGFIEPGKEGEVFVRFKSAGKRGNQNKTVTLMTNSADNKPVVLTLRGMVTLPKTEGDQ